MKNKGTLLQFVKSSNITPTGSSNGAGGDSGAASQSLISQVLQSELVWSEELRRKMVRGCSGATGGRSGKRVS